MTYEEDSNLEADQRDAALTQQAYWVVRAYSEGLIDGGQEDTDV